MTLKFQAAMGPKERAVLIARKVGNDLAPGSDQITYMDSVLGAPGVASDDSIGHWTGLIIRLAMTLTTNIAMGAAMPGGLLAAFVQNIRVRAAGVDLFDGGQLDGEDLNQLANIIKRGQMVPFAADVPDATGTPATGDIYVHIPFSSTLIDRFKREGDGAIPVAAFDRRSDPEHGLRFRLAAVTDLAKGFLSVTPLTYTALDIWGVYRQEDNPLFALPGLRAYTETQLNFGIDPIGGPMGTQLCVMIFDNPSTSTGQRTHTTYAQMQAKFGADMLYTGLSFSDLVDVNNFTDLGRPVTTGWVGRTNPNFLQLFVRRMDNPTTEEARGRLDVNIGTRGPANSRILQACVRQFNQQAADRINASLGGSYKGAVPIASSTQQATNEVIMQVLPKKLVK